MEKGFWAVPKLIANNADLSFKAKMIAGILWTRKNADFQAYPSRKYMAESLGVSTDTIDRGIKELKEKAGLKVQRAGLRRNNRYSFSYWDPESAELPNQDSATVPIQESATVQSPIVRDNKKDNTVVDDGSSNIKEIIFYFRSKVKLIKGYEPEISWAKEGALVKQRLRNYQPKKLKNLIDWYLSSQYSERFGDCLAVCLSTRIINLWKASNASIPFYYRKFL